MSSKRSGFVGKNHGFTIIEMLVAVFLIIALTVLIFPTFRSARLGALKSKDLGNMRQIGIAIFGFTTDNDQNLPGPTPVGQMPTYRGNDKPQNAPNLAFYLASYLSCPIPPSTSGELQICPPFVNAGLKATQGGNVATQINYIVNYGTPNLPGDSLAYWRRTVFGSIWYSPAIAPMKLAVLAQNSPKDIWMLCNVDQECTAPSLTASGWFTSLPKKPVHGSSRNFLFADGHVEAKSLDFQP